MHSPRILRECIVCGFDLDITEQDGRGTADLLTGSTVLQRRKLSTFQHLPPGGSRRCHRNEDPSRLQTIPTHIEHITRFRDP